MQKQDSKNFDFDFEYSMYNHCLQKQIEELKKENSEQKIRIAALTSMLTYDEPYTIQTNRYTTEYETKLAGIIPKSRQYYTVKNPDSEPPTGW